MVEMGGGKKDGVPAQLYTCCVHVFAYTCVCVCVCTCVFSWVHLCASLLRRVGSYVVLRQRNRNAGGFICNVFQALEDAEKMINIGKKFKLAQGNVDFQQAIRSALVQSR